MTLDVVYEDNHLLVLNKPHGLLTQPSGTDLDSLEDRAKAWLKKKYGKTGNVFLQAIHRLDRAAGGIVVFAKTSKALARLTKAVRERNVTKTYEAWVEGCPENDSGRLEHWLIHDHKLARVARQKGPEAKFASLNYRVLRKENKRSLLEIDLETGRYHQIRAQFAAIGCPILGDVKYGSRLPFGQEGIALEHVAFSLPHPVSGEMHVFSIPRS